MHVDPRYGRLADPGGKLKRPGVWLGLQVVRRVRRRVRWVEASSRVVVGAGEGVGVGVGKEEVDEGRADVAPRGRRLRSRRFRRRTNARAMPRRRGRLRWVTIRPNLNRKDSCRMRPK